MAREKINRFDHERIPERVVHARGAGAFGKFTMHKSLEQYTTAGVLTDTSRTTPVFLRFSTVLGSRGSADTVRDVRGFAVKFYTDEVGCSRFYPSIKKPQAEIRRVAGQLGHRWKQHAGVFHTRRNKIPGCHSFWQA